jgi:hypothetical protein
MSTKMEGDERMQIETQKRKRAPFNLIAFSDCRNGVNGFAKDWYFWVPASFKPALDVGYNEYLDDEKTQALRDKRSHELYGVSHEALKKQIEANGDRLSDSEDHKRIMSFAIRYPVETQGEPPLYAFRETDSLESRSGHWYVQVEQALADTDERQGNVGFRLYARHRGAGAGEGVWVAKAWLATSQHEFVELLRTGRCAAIDLSDPLPDQDAAAGERPGAVAA